MTSEAIELLVNCLTSKESELWHSLGESWYISRQEWKGYVPPDRPVFMDGWSPPVFYDDGDRPRGDSPPVDEVDAPSREMYRSDFNILLEFDVLLFMQNIDYRLRRFANQVHPYSNKSRAL